MHNYNNKVIIQKGYISVIPASPIDEGYIISDSELIECEYGRYFIDKYGRVFEYDYGYDLYALFKIGELL